MQLKMSKMRLWDTSCYMTAHTVKITAAKKVNAKFFLFSVLRVFKAYSAIKLST